MSSWNNGTTASKPLRWPGVVKRSRLAVQLHVPGEDTRAEHPWVVEVALASLNEQDLELVVQVGQTASNNTTASPSVLIQFDADGSYDRTRMILLQQQ